MTFKTGDRVIVVDTKQAGSTIRGRTSDYYYKKGWIGTVKSAGRYSLVVDFSEYKGPLAFPDVGIEDVQEASPVAVAQYNLDKAQVALQEAQQAAEKEAEAKRKAEEEAKRFTEKDVKNLTVVSFLGGELRLLIVTNERVLWLDSTGSVAHQSIRSDAVSNLNSMYQKTTKTLKDFANEATV